MSRWLTVSNYALTSQNKKLIQMVIFFGHSGFKIISMIYSMYSYKEDPVYHPVAVIKDEERSWKRILIVDDERDITLAFKIGIEESNNDNDVNKRIEVYVSNNPLTTLSEFKPNFYDLLLVDIKMPLMNGFKLSEKILTIDINVKICFMSSVEINREALREIYPTRQALNNAIQKEQRNTIDCVTLYCIMYSCYSIVDKFLFYVSLR
jgi:CheY-like chemotaxis protein